MKMVSLGPSSEPGLPSKLWFFFEGTGLTIHILEEDCPKKRKVTEKLFPPPPQVVNVLWCSTAKQSKFPALPKWNEVAAK